MAWKKGQSGNPLGRPKEKAFADTIRMVLAEDCPKTGKRKLRRLAEKLYEQAMKGEAWAMCQIADRLDGKPAQASTLTLEDNRPASQLSDEELMAIARGGMGLCGESTDSVL
jgi:hypothetical protein